MRAEHEHLLRSESADQYIKKKPPLRSLYQEPVLHYNALSEASY